MGGGTPIAIFTDFGNSNCFDFSGAKFFFVNNGLVFVKKDTLVFSCDYVVDDDVVGRMDDLFDLSHEVRLEVFIERSHVTHILMFWDEEMKVQMLGVWWMSFLLIRQLSRRGARLLDLGV